MRWIVGKGIGVPFRMGGSGLGSSYWTQRLDMWHKERSSAVISESLKDNPASIVPAVASFNGSNNCVKFPNIAAYNFTGDFYIYIQHITFGTLPGTGTIISKESHALGAEWRLDLLDSGRFYFYVFYGGVVTNSWRFATPTGVVASNGSYYDILISYKSSTETCFFSINGLTKTMTPTESGTTSVVVQGVSPLTIGALGRATPLQYMPCKIGLVQCGAEYVESVAAITTNFFKTPLSGVGAYEYDVTSGGIGTWAGASPHIAYHANGSRFAFDNGFKIYEKSGSSDEQVPAGGSVATIEAAGYTLKSTHAASSQYINKASGLINFNYLGLTAGGYADIVFVGDSMTLGTGTPPGDPYPDQLAAKFLSDDAIDINITNLGVGSKLASEMLTDAPTNVYPLLSEYKKTVIVWAGVNDLILLPQQTKEATYQSIYDLCIGCKNAGFDVFVMTLLPQDAYVRADYEEARGWINNKIRTELGLEISGVVDIAADNRIGDENDDEDITYYDGSKLHLNTTGYGVVSDLAYAEIKTTVLANRHVGLASLDIFDKNNSTIHIATGSMPYVDTTNYFLWRMDEIEDYDTCQANFNDDYKDRVFAKIESGNITEILTCKEQQTGSALTKAKTYCGIT